MVARGGSRVIMVGEARVSSMNPSPHTTHPPLQVIMEAVAPLTTPSAAQWSHAREVWLCAQLSRLLSASVHVCGTEWPFLPCENSWPVEKILCPGVEIQQWAYLRSGSGQFYE